MGNGLNFRGGADRFVGSQTTLRVNQVGSKDSVNQGRLSKTRLAFPSSQFDGQWFSIHK